jgi:nucleoside-diphosphate-sugar epimerase
MKQQKIFITGGAGYIGTSLIPLLLNKEYKVTVYDSLMFNNGDKLIPFFQDKNFNFIKGDIMDLDKLKTSMKGHDVIIHLAALVGFPICREKGEHESYKINVTGTQNIINCLTPDQYLLFGSTGSNYGEVKGICTEETPLNPLSIYGKTKTQAETLVMRRNNSTAFRFATAFGVSPRLRLDLLVNDLTYKSFKEGYSVIYESHFLRTFIHVRDIANVFLFAIQNQEKMINNVYNVGSNKMNFSKKEICKIIQTHLPKAQFNYSGTGEDEDKRNYQVSYDKINELGYTTLISIDEGIKELIKVLDVVNINSPYYNILK